MYRRRLEEFRELTNANALAIRVAAGSAEATALGNVAVQAIALSRLPDLAVARSIIAASFPPRIFLPE